MSVDLIVWGREYTQQGNRSNRNILPPPGDPSLLASMAEMTPTLAAIGFSGLQLPPSSKAQGGCGLGVDGYEVYDLRDLGNKHQQGSVRTSWGTLDETRRLIGLAHSYGMTVALDVVLHQRGGAAGCFYRPLGADGRTENGRGAMHPGCFRRTAGGSGTQPEDAVPVPADDFPFGDQVVYQNCDPAGYTINDALDYGNWLFRSLGADGGRMDDPKGMWTDFVARFMNHGEMALKTWYSEYFDANPEIMWYWANHSPMNCRSGVEDFTAHFAFVNAANGFTAWPLEQSLFAARHPNLSYVFVDNPDTDTSEGEGVIFNKVSMYAIALSMACRKVLIYGKDYFGPDVWPTGYGLKPWIDNLVYIHQKFAYGAQTTRWCDDKVFALERDGNGGAIGSSAGLITAINLDTWNPRTIRHQTHWWPGTRLHDYAGHIDDVYVDGDGYVQYTIPSNANSSGLGYVCLSQAFEATPISWNPRHTTQSFYGDFDLDIPGATTSLQMIGRLFVQGRTFVAFQCNTPRVLASLYSDGVRCGNIPPESGWYSVGVQAPSAVEPVAFELTVTYAGA